MAIVYVLAFIPALLALASLLGALFLYKKRPRIPAGWQSTTATILMLLLLTFSVCVTGCYALMFLRPLRL